MWGSLFIPRSSLSTCQGSIFVWIVAPLPKYPDGISYHVHHSHHQDFPQKSPNESGAHELLETCYIAYHDNDSADHSQLAHNLLNDGCQGTYYKFLNDSKTSFSFLLRCVMKVSLSTIFQIWGPMKTPLILAWLREGNFSARYTNAEDFLSKAFTNCLNKPSLICEGSKKILSFFTSGLYLMLCFPCSILSRIGQSLRTNGELLLWNSINTGYSKN